MKKKTAILFGASMAIFILLFGFGGMFWLWNNIQYPNNLLGLFDYKAATWGDGLCLPIMIFCLCTFNFYNSKKFLKQIMWCRIAAIIAIIIAVLIQGSWLWSNDTILNWSLPIKHYFNIAGWYHSLFFIMMFGLVAYHITFLGFQIKTREKSYDWFEMKLCIFLVASGTTFILLHMDDDYSSKISMGYMFSIILFVLLLFFSVFIIYTKKEVNSQLQFSLLLGLICAYGVALFICSKHVGGDIFLAIGGAFCSCFIWTEKSNLSKTIFLSILTTVIYFFVLFSVSTLENYSEIIVILFSMLVISILIEKKSFGKLRFHFWALLLVSFYIFLKKFPDVVLPLLDNFNIDDGFIINALFNFVLYIIFEREITNLFDTIIDLELKKNMGEIGEEEFKKGKKNCFFKIVLSAIGIICLLICWLNDVVNSTHNILDFPIGTLSINKLFFGGCVICLIMMFAVSKTSVLKRNREKIIILLTVATFSFLIINTVYYFLQNFMGNIINLNVSQKILLIITLFAVIGSSWLIAYGYEMNLIKLRGIKANSSVSILSKVLFVGGTIISFCNVILFITQLTIISIILIFINAFFFCELVPVLSAKSLQIDYKKTDVVPNTPVGGIRQDGFSVLLIQVFVVGIPCVYIGVLPKANFNVWINLISIMVHALLVVGFFLKNNVEHVERQKMVLATKPEEGESWLDLRKCLMKQSLITIFTMLPYCLVFGLIQTIKYIFRIRDKDSDVSIKKFLIMKYIDKQRYSEDFSGLMEEAKNIEKHNYK